MKRKLVTLALSAVLCLSMSIAAFAAPSAEVNGSGSADNSGSTSIETSVATGEGVAIYPATADSYAGTGYYAAVVELEAATEDAAEMIEAIETITEGAVQVEKVIGGKIIDITPTTLTVNANGKYDLEITDSAVSYGDIVVVLHCNNGTWENVPVMVGKDGVIRGEVDSFSPFYIGKIVRPAANPNPPTEDAVVSPKTAEIIGLGLIAVAAAGAAVVCGTRKNNK